MQCMGNQADTQNQFEDDGQSSHQKREIETEKMITVNVNLELVHIENLEDSRDDEHKAQQDLQDRFTERFGQYLGFVIVSTAKQVLPPAGFLTRHLIFRHFIAYHLSPTHDFLGFVGTRRTVFNSIVIFAQVNHFLILNGGTLTIACLLT